ncbi:MAG: hypothetical protein ACOZF0_06755 [Thermodesulfobacteriota bacterium]
MDRAISLSREMSQSTISLHDFFADSCAVLWSWVSGEMGEDSLPALFRFIFFHAARRQYFDAARAQVMPHLTVGLLAKSWRAHSCFGAGPFPGKFHISEDEEKFTFHLHPCGSGARLWLRGIYAEGKGGACVRQARTWTYGRDHFPVYCVHCPFLNEILPWESTYGALLWPVDPPEKFGKDECRWYVYKNPGDIPEHHYGRLGIRRKRKSSGSASGTFRRIFSERELVEMSRPVTDRLAEALGRNDIRQSARLVREVRDEFLTLHDLYVMMISATLTYIAAFLGEDRLGNALEVQYERCVRPILRELAGRTAMDRVAFLAGRVFGADACNGTGLHGARFHLEETDQSCRFILAPCGSGGRLINSGACDPMPLTVRYREQVENSLARWGTHLLPLPEKPVAMVFPRLVTHFTQRKPYDQGRTRSPRSWSFDRKNLPYYCCQCGMLQQKLGDSVLRIRPPYKKGDVCRWEIDP